HGQGAKYNLTSTWRMTSKHGRTQQRAPAGGQAYGWHDPTGAECDCAMQAVSPAGQMRHLRHELGEVRWLDGAELQVYRRVPGLPVQAWRALEMGEVGTEGDRTHDGRDRQHDADKDAM